MSEIRTIQFKRGKEDKLIEKLRVGVLGIPLAGEPVYAIDTHILKIGDGINDYEHLPAITGGTGDIDFIIHNPLDDQILYYSSSAGENGAWINVNLSDLLDNKSIIYSAQNGITLKGYESAQPGHMLVKDSIQGLRWERPVDDHQLEEFVELAGASAGAASISEGNAANYAAEALDAKTAAERINEETVRFVEEKFWWGTLAEYNELPYLDKDVFYFIIPEA